MTDKEKVRRLARAYRILRLFVEQMATCPACQTSACSAASVQTLKLKLHDAAFEVEGIKEVADAEAVAAPAVRP